MVLKRTCHWCSWILSAILIAQVCCQNTSSPLGISAAVTSASQATHTTTSTVKPTKLTVKTTTVPKTTLKPTTISTTTTTSASTAEMPVTEETSADTEVMRERLILVDNFTIPTLPSYISLPTLPPILPVDILPLAGNGTIQTLINEGLATNNINLLTILNSTVTSFNRVPNVFATLGNFTLIQGVALFALGGLIIGVALLVVLAYDAKIDGPGRRQGYDDGQDGHKSYFDFLNYLKLPSFFGKDDDDDEYKKWPGASHGKRRKVRVKPGRRGPPDELRNKRKKMAPRERVGSNSMLPYGTDQGQVVGMMPNAQGGQRRKGSGKIRKAGWLTG